MSDGERIVAWRRAGQLFIPDAARGRTRRVLATGCRHVAGASRGAVLLTRCEGPDRIWSSANRLRPVRGSAATPSG